MIEQTEQTGSGLRVFREGHGEPLLFIHGCVSDRSYFRDAGTLLSDAFAVIRYDRRGYGDSPRPENGDYSIRAQALDALEVADRFSSDRPVWVAAHSGGTLIALELMLRAPKRVRGAILVEPPLTYDPAVGSRLTAWFDEIDGFARQKKTARAILVFADTAGDRRESGGRESLEEVARTVKNMQAFLTGERQDMQSYHPEEAALRSLQIPAAIVVSEEGRQKLFGQTSVSLAGRLGWPLYAVEGFHNAPKYRQEAFARLVRAFVDQHRIC